MHEHLESLLPPEENPFFKALGIKPTFADEGQAPPVDVKRLEKYYRGELNSDMSQEVRDCVSTFRSWYSAMGEVVRNRG